jgi:hypothetical protein
LMTARQHRMVMWAQTTPRPQPLIAPATVALSRKRRTIR